MKRFAFLSFILIIILSGNSIGVSAKRQVKAPFLYSGFSYSSGKYFFSDSTVKIGRCIEDDLVNSKDSPPLSYIYDGNLKVSNFGSFILTSNPDDRWSDTFLTGDFGSNTIFSSDMKYVAYMKDNGFARDYDYLMVIDTVKMEIIYSYKSETIYSYLSAPEFIDDILIFGGDEEYHFIDLNTGSKFLTLSGNEYGYQEFDDHYGYLYLRESRKIIDKESKKILGEFNVPGEHSTHKFRDDHIEVLHFYFHPHGNYGATELKVTRCDKFFNITDEFSFTPRGNIKNKTLFGSFENLALCLDFVSHTLEVYDMISGDLRFTQQFQKNQIENVEFRGSKALIKWEGGLEVLNLETLSVENQFTFPRKTELLKHKNSVFQIRELIDEDLKMSNELFQIGSDNKPIYHTRTILPHGGVSVFMNDETEVVTIEPKTRIISNNGKPEIYGYIARFHKLGSRNHYKEYLMGYSYTKDFFYKDGNVYTISERGIFEYNLETGNDSIIDNSGVVRGAEKADCSYNYNNENLLVSFKSYSHTWTRCYDLSEKSKIFEDEKYSENIHLFCGAFVIDNKVVPIDTLKEYEFEGTPCFVDGEIFIYASGNTTYFLDLETGEKTDNGGVFAVTQDFSKLGGLYLSGQTIIDSKGIPIQKLNLSQTAISENQLFYDNESYLSFFSTLEPCPTFSIKRIENSDDDKISFEIEYTRNDGITTPLEGQAYLIPWKYDLILARNSKKVQLEPMLPGMKQNISFEPADSNSAIFAPSLSSETNTEDEGNHFALIIESNGMLDVANSELSEIDDRVRPLFDGTPVSFEEQKAVVLTVWENEP